MTRRAALQKVVCCGLGSLLVGLPCLEARGAVEPPPQAAPLNRGTPPALGVIDQHATTKASPTPALPPKTANPVSVSPPPEPRIAGRPQTGRGLMIAGGTIAGAGVVMAIVFGALTRGCRDDGPLECRYREQDTMLLPLGITVTTAGIMLLAVGGAYWGRYRRWQRNSSTASVFGVHPRLTSALFY